MVCVLWLVTSVDSLLPQHSSIGGVGKGNFYQRGSPIYKERADCLVRTDRTATHLYYHRLEAGLLPERGLEAVDLERNQSFTNNC